MPTPRKQQISLENTPYYHCVSRCVRRAFLCGRDAYSGVNYEHRRAWLEERILAMQSVFCIDVCAYAIMNNHYHVVLHVDLKSAEALTDIEVIERWTSLFSSSPLIDAYSRPDGKLRQSERKVVLKVVDEWRKRLTDISWFMRCCNEWMARMSNKEDQCTGRFWEGRYKCQALLDEKALAACMAYVDLNPVRAKMAQSPESSLYTSFRKRAKAANRALREFNNPDHVRQQCIDLFPFAGSPRKNIPQGLPFKLRDYFELVDWTSRQLRSNKYGAMSSNTPLLLQRLGIGKDNWLDSSQHFESTFRLFAGTMKRIRAVCEGLGYQRISTVNLLS